MDLHLVENIVAIEDEKSITRAAEKRFITQSALNQQLQKLEEELGTELFRRQRGNWQPTEAGKKYLAAARQMLAIKKEAYAQIADCAEVCRRTLSVGLIPERGVDMFTAVYPAFHRAYPQVRVEPAEYPVRLMQQLISRGQLDLGLATLAPEQRDESVYHDMVREEIVLAAPKGHALAAEGAADWRDAPQTELERFSGEPFIRIYQRSTLFELTEQLFSRAGFTPRVLFSTSSNVSKGRIVQAGLGCALLPASYAGPKEGVVYFRLPGRPAWDITLFSRKGRELNGPERLYISLCRDYWKKRLE